MNPAVITAALFWSAVALGVLCLARDPWYQTVWKRDWRPILIGIVVVLCWRWPRDGQFFFGLEYEDSYVYTVVGRQLAENLQPTADATSYLTSVCAVGNLRECIESETYSGHYIGLPYVVSLAAHVVGYSPHVGYFVALLAAVVTAAGLWAIGVLIDPTRRVAVAALTVFALTPVFAVYGTGASAEPLSNACVTLTLMWCLRFMVMRLRKALVVMTWLAFMTAVLFATVVKRENAILAAVFPLGWLVSRLFGRGMRGTAVRAWALCLTAILVAAFVSTQLGLARTLASETSEYAGFPFGIGIARRMLPLFATAFLNASWYFGMVAFVLIGATVVVRAADTTLWLLLAFIVYLALYSSHVRSYYMLFYGDVNPRDTLRYSTNMMSLWSLVAGIGLAAVVRWGRQMLSGTMYRRWPRILLAGVMGLLAVVSFGVTSRMRGDLAEDEFRIRIKPALEAVRLASEGNANSSYIVTTEPLLLQIYGGRNLNVVSIESVNEQLLDRIVGGEAGARVLYVKQSIYATDPNQHRYQRQYEVLRKYQQHELYRDENATIVLLSL